MERFKNKFLTIEECKTLLYSYPAKVNCFTCGKEGVWFKEEGKPWQFKDALSVTNVVDVTGAGDAFWADFDFEYMKDRNITACVQKGLETAAKKIQRNGSLCAC